MNLLWTTIVHQALHSLKTRTKKRHDSENHIRKLHRITLVGIFEDQPRFEEDGDIVNHVRYIAQEKIRQHVERKTNHAFPSPVFVDLWEKRHGPAEEISPTDHIGQNIENSCVHHVCLHELRQIPANAKWATTSSTTACLSARMWRNDSINGGIWLWSVSLSILIQFRKLCFECQEILLSTVPYIIKDGPPPGLLFARTSCTLLYFGRHARSVVLPTSVTHAHVRLFEVFDIQQKLRYLHCAIIFIVLLNFKAA